MSIDPLWAVVLSDLFINLSAGWFGAALIVPAVAKKKTVINLGILLFNLIFGIVFLIIGFQLRELGLK